MDTTTIEISTILALAGAISALGGAWLTIRKLNADYKKQRDLEAAKILQSAKEEISKLKMTWQQERALHLQMIDNKINDVQSDLDTHKDIMAKDLAHIRETYNGEIRNLGQKIEDLRSELRGQHGQLVSLLSKMIENS